MNGLNHQQHPNKRKVYHCDWMTQTFPDELNQSSAASLAK
jgi:hypothetical protein